MMPFKPSPDVIVIGGHSIERGSTQEVRLSMSQTYTGVPITLPVHVSRALEPGPTVLLTAAVHGDEINGTGIIRELVFAQGLELKRGSLICIPVVDIFGFETHERYMPDGRDLNRSFPGMPAGSLTSRFANTLMTELVAQADVGIDLHSAARGRTNFPNVRADLSNPQLRELAVAFGCELIVNSKGPAGSLRRCATDRGCPTFILEAGEPHKIEQAMLEVGLRGVRNVLAHLGMIDHKVIRPAYQTRIRKTSWLRASLGGLLRFHVGPGQMVSGGQPLATNESIFGQAQTIIIAPADGIVLGMTTRPAVKPGEPIIHIAYPRASMAKIRAALDATADESPEQRVRDDLATNIVVSPLSRDCDDASR